MSFNSGPSNGYSSVNYPIFPHDQNMGRPVSASNPQNRPLSAQNFSHFFPLNRPQPNFQNHQYYNPSCSPAECHTQRNVLNQVYPPRQTFYISQPAPLPGRVGIPGAAPATLQGAQPLPNAINFPVSATPAQTSSSSVTQTAEGPVSTKKKRNRQVYNIAQNETPSVKTNGVYDKQLAEDHAFMRMQLFAVTAFALKKLGVRSDSLKRKSTGEELELDGQPIAKKAKLQKSPPSHPKIKMKVEDARAQVGSGTNSGEVPTNACHAHPTPGGYDNTAEKWAEEITVEQKITPMKEKRMRALGATQDDLDKVEAAGFTEAEVQELIDRLIPGISGKKSVFEKGRLWKLINMTNELPRTLNLKVDLSIEMATRDKINAIYEQLAEGSLSVRSACIRYQIMTFDHLEKMISGIEERLVYLEGYKQLFDQLKTQPFTKEFVKAFFEQWQLVRTKVLPNRVGLGKLKMELNAQFNNDAGRVLWKIASGDIQAFGVLHCEFTQQLDALLKEVEDILEEQKMLLEYCKQEQKGTQVPDLSYLFEFYDAEKKEREPLSSADKENLRMELLSPLPKPERPKSCRQIQFEEEAKTLKEGATVA